MSESGSGGAIGFGNNSRFPYYGPGGRLVLDEYPEKGILMEQMKNKEVND